jgi:hypothetical protein
MEYLGARGTLIHEKNLKSKISCQAPFNHGDRQITSNCAGRFIPNFLHW